MDNSENQSYDDNRLRKDEILRGHNVYLKVLQNSSLVSTDLLKAFINKESREPVPDDFTKSPLFTYKVKVGFVIAKKHIKKATFRNRIRRLLKESYRLNKKLFSHIPLNINVLFSLTEKGYEYFKMNSKTKAQFVSNEMVILIAKIIKHVNKQ